ncbi:hypothetical protein LCGC14_1869750 [marine sediment metagenome]|uniref:AB hydrolase-1 domain-containing protein n=1 Tax=marine sediment metagenome TaxID=412755 RepID=A0A0F9J422_9ZZZZ|nr:alpha/beta fold hydrolase [bacterium]
MRRLNKIRSNRKKLVLVISLIITFIGVFPLLILTYLPELKYSYNIKPLALKSEDGVYISAFKYTPVGEKNHGGVVVGHSLLGSKVSMQPLSLELVKRGFTVISIDFRSHGASGGVFYRSKLLKDMIAAVEYIENNLHYITEIGLVGHSLGAEIALILARTYPNRINATVAIGKLISNMTGISNLLLANGKYDPGTTEENILEALKSYTMIKNVEIGETYYGDFNDGNNIRAFVSPFSEHLFTIVDSAILYETIQWFEQAFNGEIATDIFVTASILQIFSYISLFGIIMLNSILVVYLGNYFFKHKKKDSIKEKLTNKDDFSIKKLIGAYAILVVVIQLVAFYTLSEISSDVIPVSTVSIILSLVIGASIGSFVVYNFLLLCWEDKYSLKKFYSRIKIKLSPNSGRSILYGGLIALIVVLSLAAIWNWSVLNTLPTLSEFGIIILISVLSFPFFLIKEFYFRDIQEKLNAFNRFDEYYFMVGIGIFIDNLLIIGIIIIGKINLAYLPESALYLLVWVIFSIIQNIAVTWVYINGRNILGTTAFLSIFYAWISVVFLPSYGFL